MYLHLRDAMVTFIGGPRHMHEYAPGALTYVRQYGRPDRFITFTSNQTWEEIKEHLFPGEVLADRPDRTTQTKTENND